MTEPTAIEKEILALHHQGLDILDIADETGASAYEIWDCLRAYGEAEATA